MNAMHGGIAPSRGFGGLEVAVTRDNDTPWWGASELPGVIPLSFDMVKRVGR